MGHDPHHHIPKPPQDTSVVGIKNSDLLSNINQALYIDAVNYIGAFISQLDINTL